MKRRSKLLLGLGVALAVVILVAAITGFGGDFLSLGEDGPRSGPAGEGTPTPSPAPSTAPVPPATPTQTPVPTPTLTPTRNPSQTYTDIEFYRALDKTGASVDRAQFEQYERDQGNLSQPLVVDYITETTTPEARRDEVGRIAQTYANAVAKGYQRAGIDATIYNESGRPVASYRIERSWAVAYNQGEISATEYGQRIGRTYRSSTTPQSTASRSQRESSPTASSEPDTANETETNTLMRPKPIEGAAWSPRIGRPLV